MITPDFKESHPLSLRHLRGYHKTRKSACILTEIISHHLFSSPHLLLIFPSTYLSSLFFLITHYFLSLLFRSIIQAFSQRQKINRILFTIFILHHSYFFFFFSFYIFTHINSRLHIIFTHINTHIHISHFLTYHRTYIFNSHHFLSISRNLLNSGRYARVGRHTALVLFS